MKKFFLSLLAAGAVLFALPACEGLGDLLNQGDDEENVDDNGNGTSDENLPPYYNFKTDESGDTITYSFSFRAGSENYYDVKYEWTFREDVCTKCIETFNCKSNEVALLVAAEYSDDPNVSVSGKNILIDMTEDFNEYTKEEVRTWIKQLEAAMEIVNAQATNPGE